MKLIVSGKRAAAALAGFCILLAAVLGTGISRAVSAGSSGVAVPILMYHSVGYNKTPSKYILSPEVFEEDLRWLSERGYTAVFVSELVAYVQGKGSLPERPVVITLDDGFLNNRTYVLPLLQKYKMKAVLSVVGSFCDEFTAHPDPDPAYAYLTWEDVDDLAHSGYFEIGNHTYDLHSVSDRKGCMKKDDESASAYSEFLSKDLTRLQSMLYEKAGITPTVFAYPYGAVSGEALFVLQSLGFSAALTCSEQVNYLSVGKSEALYRLGRFNRPSGVDTKTFMKRVFE